MDILCVTWTVRSGYKSYWVSRNSGETCNDPYRYVKAPNLGKCLRK